jgi:hypothetical protein
MARVLVLAVAAAAVARGVARHGLELAHVTVGLAAHRVAADAHGRRRRDDARDGHSRTAGQPGRPAAVRVLRAQVADDVTPARRLAYEDAARTPRRARAAAARSAARRQPALGRCTRAARPRSAAELPVDNAAVGGPSGWGRPAGSERLPGSDGARSGTAVGRGGARVAPLTAERRRLARAVHAEPGAALPARSARVAQRQAHRVEGRALAARARLAAAVPVRRAAQPVRGARRVAALAVRTDAAAAIAASRAPAPEAEARAGGAAAERASAAPAHAAPAGPCEDGG